MIVAERRRELLAKARDADDQADKARDEEARESWQRIAAGYRELAERHI